MSDPYLPRTLEPVLKQAAEEFPVVVLTGPRQSGKTTLLRRLYGKRYRYVSLEPPDIRAAATADPRGFMAMHPPPVIFDEIQYASDLLPYIKEHVDANRKRKGMYLLTGSQNLLLMQNVTESLAGRAAILRLLPLSWREATGQAQALFPWETRHRRKPLTRLELWKGFLRGGYPELVSHPRREFALWHSSYIQTYLERDVRMLRQVADLSQFQNFLRALAARSAQLLSLSDIARDLGVAVNTIKTWLSILEATYQIVVVRPYFANVGKRLVKAPKIYFTDTGTLCHLTGLRDPEHAVSGPLAGAIMETAVLSEIVRTMHHRGREPNVYFWRTSTGVEVDFILETANGLVPIEVKASSTITPNMASGIKAFRDDLGKRAAPGYVVHPGETRLPLGGETTALPFFEL